MREILFRGKRVDNGEWAIAHNIVIGKSEKCTTRVFIVPKGEYIDDAITKDNRLILVMPQVEIVPETIGQYTGLTDKNGKKIFEGDVILFEDESPTNYEYHDSTEMRCGEIKFDWGEFYLTNRVAVEMSDLVYDNKLDGQIVGNIHDNPELLKGE